jgi:DNA-directed RNA polymerase subunit K/omega
MQTELLTAAIKVFQIGGSESVVSRRVRQLTFGHKQLVAFVPGMLAADIALTEIIEGTITFESTPGQDGKEEPTTLVKFPGSSAGTKKAA